MKQPINEIRRMQQLAGIIKESQLNGGTIIYKGPTEDLYYRKEIYHNNNPILTAETNQEKQQEISTLLGKGDKNIDQMYEPSQLANVLGYDNVKELAIAIAEKIGAEFKIED